MSTLVRTQILFEDSDLRELKRLAKSRGVSVSSLVRNEVKKKVIKKKEKSMARAMLELADWAKKNKIKAPSDLGRNDDYLYGPIRSKE